MSPIINFGRPMGHPFPVWTGTPGKGGETGGGFVPVPEKVGVRFVPLVAPVPTFLATQMSDSSSSEYVKDCVVTLRSGMPWTFVDTTGLAFESGIHAGPWSV